MTDKEFNQYKLQVLAKSNGMNIHKVHNMLAAMEMSLKEYLHNKDRQYLKIVVKSKREINKCLVA